MMMVMDAYRRVSSNRGNGGVAGISMTMFDRDYKNYLYKLWNLGYTFSPRQSQNSIRKETFSSWLPAVSKKAMKSMNETMRGWSVLKTPGSTTQEVAKSINPVLRSWINYYSKFYKTKLKDFMHIVNVKLASWARKKYKNLRASEMKAIRWLHGISVRRPSLFAHWSLGSKPTLG